MFDGRGIHLQAPVQPHTSRISLCSSHYSSLKLTLWTLHIWCSIASKNTHLDAWRYKNALWYPCWFFDINIRLKTDSIVTCRPSIANLSMLGVNLEACLKVKLLQSMIKTNPFTCSSGSSIIVSRESKIARRISTKVYLQINTSL